ncbi:hypothetical protein [Ferviditalea candida]|uniref:Uncharacterized protein n=1 Tax=Ferviditalea candida TaxID=3108399 RepID=A0ABU5ZJE4_9BACL|nr:hypothetical protein [Paenibacillaceae bacterium T2]
MATPNGQNEDRYVTAALNSEQLKKLQKLEDELDAILIAYEPTDHETPNTPTPAESG